MSATSTSTAGSRTLPDCSYPFEFIGISMTGADAYQLDTLIYRFRSTKSLHEYEVHVERYIEHLCCIKFFDTSSVRSLGRFSQMTDTFEPRTIFRTVADIALDALRHDPMASFCFIGAADRRDTPGGIKTRRYRVYKEFIRRLGLEQQFELAFYDEQSLAILVNRTAVTDISTYAQRLLEFI
jgi:hypothetical protein